MCASRVFPVSAWLHKLNAIDLTLSRNAVTLWLTAKHHMWGFEAEKKNKKQLGSLCKSYLFCAPSSGAELGQFEFFSTKKFVLRKNTQPPSRIPSALQASHFQGTRSEPGATLSHRHDDKLMTPTCLTTAENFRKATRWAVLGSLSHHPRNCSRGSVLPSSWRSLASLFVSWFTKGLRPLVLAESAPAIVLCCLSRRSDTAG